MKLAINEKFKKNNFPLILFFIIFINYLPVFLNNGFTKESKSVNIVIMALCFIVEIFLLLCFYKINKNDIRLNKKKMIVLLIIITMMTLVQLSNFLQNNFFIMDIFNIGCIFINIFLLYIVIYDFEVQELELKKIFKGILFIGIIAIIWNIVLFYKEISNNLGIINLTSNPYRDGIKSFFANRNSLAFFLFFTIIANCFLMMIDNEKKRYKFILFVLLFGSWCTYSKTGWTISIIFLELFFIFYDRYKIKEKVCICSIIGIIGIIGFMNITGQIESNNMYRLSGRTNIWARALEILDESPLNYMFGVGRFNSTSRLVFETRTFTQFHNVYLDILLTGGLVQLIYTGFIYLSVIIKVLKSKMNKNFKKTYIIMFVMYAAYIMMESCGRFSIGAVDTLCMIFFITIPILHANSCTEIDEKEGKKKWLL